MSKSAIALPLVVLLLIACGSPPQPKAAESAGETAGAAGVAPSSSTTPPSGVSLLLAGSVPQNTDVYVEVPSVPKLLSVFSAPLLVDKGVFDPAKILGEVTGAAGRAFGVSGAEAEAVWSGVESLAIAARGIPDAPEPALLIAFNDRGAVNKLLASERFKQGDAIGQSGKRYELEASPVPSGESENAHPVDAPLLEAQTISGAIELAWFEARGLVVLAPPDMLAAIAEVVDGADDSLESSKSYQQAKDDFASDGMLFVFADGGLVTRIASVADSDLGRGFFDEPGPITLTARVIDGGLRVTLTGGLRGDKISHLDAPTAAPITLPNKLTDATLSYLAFSTKSELSGQQFEDLLVEQVGKHEPAAAGEMKTALDAMEQELGFRLATVFEAIGDEAVVATAATTEIDFEKLSIGDGVTSIYLQHIGNRQAAQRIVDAARKALGKAMGQMYRVELSASGWSATPSDSSLPDVHVEFVDDVLFVGAGSSESIAQSLAALRDGVGVLRDDKAHAKARKTVPSGAHLYGWIDLDAFAGPILDLLPSELELSKTQLGLDGISTALALGVDKQGEVWRYRLDTLNIFPIVGALAIYGVKRYLASSKTSEAKNTVGAISRGATAAYERESVGHDGHRLCKSAAPVPAFVPRSKKYQPATQPGSDYDTGDRETGWRCLKFSLTQPHYYQYSYNAGGNYKGPARGGPDPGPNGFEVAAEGDLDGDGKTSLFTRIGTLDPQTGYLKIGSQIFIVDEFE